MNIASTIDKYKQEYKKLGMTLETDVSDFIDEDHLDCLWYGGPFAIIKYNNLTIEVSAIGDVRIWGKLDGEDFYVKDKTNSGRFYDEAGQYLKDSDFSKVFSDEYLSEDELENKDNVLFIDNNNWIEPLLYDSNGNFYDLSEVMDDTNVLLSLDDPNYFKELFEYGEENLGINNESDNADDIEDSTEEFPDYNEDYQYDSRYDYYENLDRKKALDICNRITDIF